MIEVKWADTTISRAFSYFKRVFQHPIRQIQLVHNCDREFVTKEEVGLRNVINWLKDIDLLKE